MLRVLVLVMICSFSFLNGPARCETTVMDYAQLRALSGSAGASVSVTAPRIAGTFQFAASDPKGFGDDNGIVIRGRNGWWVRQIIHTLDAPIELDWFELSENQNITSLLRNLATFYRPKLYVRAPFFPVTLLMDYTDFNAIGIRRFAFLESDSPVTIRLTGTGGNLWYFENMSELVVGSLVKKENHDQYNLTLEGTWAWENRSANEGESLLGAYNNNSIVDSYYLRFNTQNAKGHGIRINGSWGANVTYVAGVHENSGMYTGMQYGKVVFEDACFSDPLGYGYGWRGGLDGASAKSQTDMPLSNPRARSVAVVATDQVVGSLTLQYGSASFGSLFVKALGNSPSEPLVVRFKDLGYSGPNQLGYPAGVALGDTWFMRMAGKFDGQDSEEPNLRFLKFVFENQYGPYHLPFGYFLEAAQLDDNPNGSGTKDSYTVFTVVNSGGSMGGTAAGNHPDDDIHHMIWQGDGVSPAQISGTLIISHADTVRNGQFHDIRIKKLDNGKGGLDNSIENVSLSGVLTIDPSIRNTKLTNVTWVGNARTLMYVGSDSDVRLENISAPAGSMIEGTGSVILDGSLIMLPYVFGGWQPGNVSQSPSISDADTVVLLHLDNNTLDSGPKNLSSGMLMRGTETYVAGKFGGALDLDGLNHLHSYWNGLSYLIIPDSSLTLEAWIKPGMQLNELADIVRWNNDAKDYIGLSIYQGKRLCLKATLHGEASYSAISSDLSKLLMDGKWHHVKGIIDANNGKSIKLFLDEMELPYINQESMSNLSSFQTKGYISVGGWTDSMTFTNFVGHIDEVSISTKAIYPDSLGGSQAIPVPLNLRIIQR